MYQPQRGNLDYYAPADPAAGAQVLITVPANRLWRIRSIMFNFATSAVVANRFVYVGLHTQTFLYAEQLGNHVQTASQTYDFYFLPGITPFDDSVNSISTGQLPLDLWMMSGDLITTRVKAMDAGDQITGVMVHLEQFIRH